MFDGGWNPHSHLLGDEAKMEREEEEGYATAFSVFGCGENVGGGEAMPPLDMCVTSRARRMSNGRVFIVFLSLKTYKIKSFNEEEIMFFA